jgi:hypothetical protein
MCSNDISNSQELTKNWTLHQLHEAYQLKFKWVLAGSLYFPIIPGGRARLCKITLSCTTYGIEEPDIENYLNFPILINSLV